MAKQHITHHSRLSAFACFALLSLGAQWRIFRGHAYSYWAPSPDYLPTCLGDVRMRGKRNLPMT